MNLQSENINPNLLKGLAETYSVNLEKGGFGSGRKKGGGFKSHSKESLENLVKKQNFDERHLENLTHDELNHLHDFANSNVFNRGLSKETSKRVKDWHHGASVESKSRQQLEKGIDENIIEKGGEGSKGGKVIGHTKSGKPIYESLDAKHENYKNFTSKDHKDAALLHARAAGEHHDESDHLRWFPSEARDKAWDERRSMRDKSDELSESHRESSGASHYEVYEGHKYDGKPDLSHHKKSHEIK